VELTVDPTEGAQAKKKILIVEDEAILAVQIEDELLSLGRTQGKHPCGESAGIVLVLPVENL